MAARMPMAVWTQLVDFWFFLLSVMVAFLQCKLPHNHTTGPQFFTSIKTAKNGG